MRCSTLSVLVGLMGAVSAAPASRHLGSSLQPRTASSLQSEEFTLAMTVNSTYLSLTAVSNGTDILILQADALSASPGSPSM